jgi:hypothetical protein
MEIPATIRLPIDIVLQLLKRFLGVSIIESGKLRLDRSRWTWRSGRVKCGLEQNPAKRQI